MAIFEPIIAQRDNFLTNDWVTFVIFFSEQPDVCHYPDRIFVWYVFVFKEINNCSFRKKIVDVEYFRKMFLIWAWTQVTWNNCSDIEVLGLHDRNPRTLDYTPGLGQAVTGLHLSPPPREAVTLTCNVMLHNNCVLLHEIKISEFSL
jgi:hypothetical protein